MRPCLYRFVWICVFLLSSVSALPSQISIRPDYHSSQEYEFDPLLHLPGISRYFDAVGFGLRHTPPPGCKVTTASYLIRHSAIYANEAEYIEYIQSWIAKVEAHRGQFTGPLKFLNLWESPIDEDKLEDITPHGLKDAEEMGEHLRKRYPHLTHTTRKILSDKKARCYDTAKAIIKGFSDSENIEVVKFHKPHDNSMNPIIPHKSCHNFSKTPGKDEMKQFVNTYAPNTAARLSRHTPFPLSNNDILAMQSTCGYESAITGQPSLLCSIFTDAEWMAYEYAWDLRYAHMVGPLNPLSDYLGFPWLQDQSLIFQNIDLHQNPSPPTDPPTIHPTSESDHGGYPPTQRFFLSFTHREVPPLIATALGIFNSSFESKRQFPVDHIVWTRAWKMSDLIPFLGHVGLEKMTCRHAGGDGDFIRVIANTAPRPIGTCQDGPGASCSMKRFVEIVKEGAEMYGDWKGMCGMDDQPSDL